MKKCLTCKKKKDNKNFHKSSYTKDGLKESCIECRRVKNARYNHKADLKRKYNLSYEKYEQMIVRQKNRCKICSNKETVQGHKKGSIRRLAVDHCHKTGKVRALLCARCNQVLGSVEESVDLLQKLIKFIKDNAWTS